MMVVPLIFSNSQQRRREITLKKGSFHKLWVVDEQKPVIDDPLGQLFTHTFFPHSIENTFKSWKSFYDSSKNSFDED